MTEPLTRDTLFKPQKLPASTKAEITKQVSMDLAQSEADVRAAKTAKLRKARLEMEARQAAEAAAKPAPRKRKKV
ncbi:hypothetical protein E1180_02005 [Roseibium denhamense]|uniref:Transcriptional regulator n=1 Tax=Roseibium denhamense TaxID=76305 RepID=A0ABY1NEJ1_9HYPH|nr:hypothetical protein [Roseibium denhamense]MTI04290.1 hypothetical protein [Roseibium denhamense]SMP07758.1 hypothetical protein SAMN06265374_0886 [Roseibium denhamense]